MGRKNQFPSSNEITIENPCVFRTREEVVQMYNDSENKNSKNLSPAIIEWTKQRAAQEQLLVAFPLAYPNRSKRAGAVFLKNNVIQLLQKSS